MTRQEGESAYLGTRDPAGSVAGVSLDLSAIKGHFDAAGADGGWLRTEGGDPWATTLGPMPREVAEGISKSVAAVPALVAAVEDLETRILGAMGAMDQSKYGDPEAPFRMRAALTEPSDSRIMSHDHKGEPKVWCRTHQHTHIAVIPRFTYQCKMCGWGQWHGIDAKAHEEACPGHETYEVEHVTGSLERGVIFLLADHLERAGMVLDGMVFSGRTNSEIIASATEFVERYAGEDPRLIEVLSGVRASTIGSAGGASK